MHTLPLKAARFATLPNTFYSTVKPEPLNQPYWIAVNETLLNELNMPSESFQTASNLAYLAGSAAEYQPQPIATVYSGHQFGGYTPRLGDGRALLLGESVDDNGNTWEWQLKGAGKTPYSRFADGRAVLRSSVREYLCSEAMHGLKIPTTRALALVGSDDEVYRETVETAAVVTRIAPSFIRFGHFEYFFYTGREAELKTLADFVIDHDYPECREADNPYLAMLQAVAERTAETVAAWQSVGFCHGVMNTDNMSILGLTIDYGPFGFMEGYDRRHVCNHSDHEGRYAYHAQPYIAHWNLAALANCFESLVPENELNDLLEQWPDTFQTAYLKRMRPKLGLLTEQADDAELIADMFAALQDKKVDFTLFFRKLSEVSNVHDDALPSELMALFGEQNPQLFIRWVGRYRQRLRAENNDHAARKLRMGQANPLYVLRNYLAQQAIELAKRGDYREIERLRRCLENPFDERLEFADFAQPAPEWAEGIAVSCSS
ncbi:YdiU family protein [Neisseria brasiliensis]|uniref:protein adenylyltransferase SelO n=1 Tax=Neisseria TaxID=482 RepID=UPI000C279216|nr:MULTISPECIES: YdiU family protein [Neisseria]PJO77281.1 YdiU family protein [Neisseria sp. N177_16]QGL24584.1 YdiU family protein [Neisseria brasiliensis]